MWEAIDDLAESKEEIGGNESMGETIQDLRSTLRTERRGLMRIRKCLKGCQLHFGIILCYSKYHFEIPNRDFNQEGRPLTYALPKYYVKQ